MQHLSHAGYALQCICLRSASFSPLARGPRCSMLTWIEVNLSYGSVYHSGMIPYLIWTEEKEIWIALRLIYYRHPAIDHNWHCQIH